MAPLGTRMCFFFGQQVSLASPSSAAHPWLVPCMSSLVCPFVDNRRSDAIHHVLAVRRKPASGILRPVPVQREKLQFVLGATVKLRSAFKKLLKRLALLQFVQSPPERPHKRPSRWS